MTEPIYETLNPLPSVRLTESYLCCRASEPSEPVQQPAATEEEAQESDRVHESTDLRAGEAIPVPEVLEPGRQGRDRRAVGLEQRASDHVVPEQAGEVEEGHGGVEEGRANGEPAAGRPTPQDVLGERAGPWYLEEATSAEQHGREVVGNETPRCSSLRENRVFLARTL